MTRMRSILLGAGTSLVLVLTACGGGSPPPFASNPSGGGSSGSSPPAVASTPSGGGSSGSSSPAVASTPSGGGSIGSTSPAVAGRSPGGGSGGSSSPAVASKSPGGGSSGGGPGLVAVTSGTAATSVKETDHLTFEPASVTVKVGDIVGFTNGGMAPHNVTFSAGPASPTMSGGDSFLVKVTRPGTYKYVCTFHPGMEGTITAG
jgi:plastocyanin